MQDITGTRMNLTKAHRRFFLAVLLGVTALPVAVTHAQPTAPSGVVFENVRIFDGRSPRLSGPSNVLVTDNVIRTISAAPIPDTPGMTVTRIRGNGRTLMPGLIDAHWHTMLSAVPAAAGDRRRPRLHDGDRRSPRPKPP